MNRELFGGIPSKPVRLAVAQESLNFVYVISRQIEVDSRQTVIEGRNQDTVSRQNPTDLAERASVCSGIERVPEDRLRNGVDMSAGSAQLREE